MLIIEHSKMKSLYLTYEMVNTRFNVLVFMKATQLNFVSISHYTVHF